MRRQASSSQILNVARFTVVPFAVVLQGTEALVGVAVGFLCLLIEGVSFGQLRRQAEEEDARTVRDEKARADSLAGS